MWTVGFLAKRQIDPSPDPLVSFPCIGIAPSISRHTQIQRVFCVRTPFPVFRTNDLYSHLGCLLLIGQRDPVPIRFALFGSQERHWPAPRQRGLTSPHCMCSKRTTIGVRRVVEGHEWVVVDELSAPLLPLTAMIFFLVIISTVGHKAHSFSYVWLWCRNR